jgi:hypothetical protein
MAIITVRQTQVSPVRFRKKTGRLFGPYGTWVGYITKDEIDYLKRWKLGKVEVLYGWWFIAHTRVHPFMRSVQRMLEIRESARSKDPVMSALMKSLAVRVNGQFLQKYESVTGEYIVGAMFNPVYACTVMTRTKLKLAEMARQVRVYGGRVLAITVDGLVATRALDREKGRKLVVTSPAVIAAPLIMHLENRHSRTRILNEIWKDPTKRVYDLGEPTRISLREAYQMGRLDRLGELVKNPVRMKVGNDVSRIWSSVPIRGGDLLDKAYVSKQPPIDYVVMGELAHAR